MFATASKDKQGDWHVSPWLAFGNAIRMADKLKVENRVN